MNLDRIVQFRRMTQTPGAFGVEETWNDFGGLTFAAKKDVSDGERWRAQEMQAAISTRFTVRWSPFTQGLTPKDRLVCEGREYDITGIKEPADTRRQWLEITASARIDQ
jgi:SPP1 family predicted phage head-tail adaptor